MGKKRTLSDIAMYNRKTDEYVCTFMSPVEDKLSAKSQIISTIDAAVVVFSQMTRALGETILMLDLMGVKTGIAVPTPYATSDRIMSITKGTSIESYSIQDRNPGMVLETLKGINPRRDSEPPVVIVVDHSFSVRGVGEVVLGFVTKGSVRRYDRLTLLPSNKEVIVRSIQVQDEDCEVAEAGTRVGLAIKGASLDELARGSVLTKSSQVRALSRIKLAFDPNPFYTEGARDGPFHVTVGMQTNPVTVSHADGGSVSVESVKPIVYEPGDVALLLDLNAKKTRIVGRGRCEADSYPVNEAG